MVRKAACCIANCHSCHRPCDKGAYLRGGLFQIIFLRKLINFLSLTETQGNIFETFTLAISLDIISFFTSIVRIFTLTCIGGGT